MANFDFQLPDGRVIRVEGAPSEEAARSFMDTQWDRLRRETPIEGFGESFGQAFRGQVTSPIGAAVAGAAALEAPEARGRLERLRQEFSPGDTRPETRAPEFFNDIVRLRNPIDALSAYTGQVAGSIAGILTGAAVGAGIGAAGGAAGGAAAGGVGAIPGAAAGAVTGAGLGTTAGLLTGGIDELYQGLTAEGVDPTLAGRVALTVGPLIGRIENRYVSQALSRALGSQVASGVAERVAARTLGGRAGGIRQTAAAGVAGEVTGETLRQATIGGITGEANLGERAERVAEAGLVGSIGGAGAGAASRAAQRITGGPQSETVRAQEAAAEAERQQEAAATAAATAPAPAAAAQPYFTRTPVPSAPEMLRTPEQTEAFLAQNTTFVPPPAAATPEARTAWVNAARQAAYQRDVGILRQSALSNFAATQPETFLSNLTQAAAEGNLRNLNSFTANDIANAALRSSGIEPGRLTKEERQFANEQLTNLANAGILAKPTATSFSVSFVPRPETATPTAERQFTRAEREASQREDLKLTAAAEAGTVGQITPFEARRLGAETLPREQAAPTAAPVTGFTTALGSTYAVNEQGQSIRTKRSPGAGQGTTYDPHNVLFVKPEDADSILEEYRQGNPYRFIVNDPAGPRRIDAGESLQGKQAALGIFTPDGQLIRYVDAQTTPAVGLSPVELRVEGTGENRTTRRHVGNPITALNQAAPAQPAARTTVEVNGVRRETTPETLQQTVDQMRAGPRSARTVPEVPARPIPAAEGIDPATVEDPANPQGPERSPEKSEPGQLTQQDPPQEWSPTSDNTPEADVDLMQTANGIYSPVVGQLPPDTQTAHAATKRATRQGMGFMGRWFYSPILTASKLIPAVRPVTRAMNAMRRRNNQYNAEIQPKLAEGAGELTRDEMKQVARLREESSVLGREADGVANLSEKARQFFNNQIQAMNRAWDMWTAANAIKYYDPASTTDPVVKARLNEFWRQHRNKELLDIPQADLRAASPEGFAVIQEFEGSRNPYYLPTSAEGTHFIAAYKIGADGKRTGKPVKMVAFNPLPLNKKGGRKPDPEVYAREELTRRGFTPDRFYITPQPVEFTRDNEARALRDNSDVLAKFLNQLSEVRSIRNDSEAQNLLRSFMTSLDKAAMKSFMRRNEGIMVPFTELNAATYLTDVVPRHMAALGKLQARTFTNDSFNRGLENLDAANKEYFKDLRDYSTQPTESSLVAGLRSLSYHYFIGPALDSMLMNMTATYSSTMPLLVRDSGNPRQAIQIGQGALNDAILYIDKAIQTDYKKFDDVIVNAGRTVKERQALRRAAQQGAFPAAMAVEMGALSEGVRTQTLVNAGIPKAESVAKAFNGLLNLFGKPQVASERVNRAAAFLAAFRLAEANPAVIERANQIDGYSFGGPDAAFEYALSRIDDTQFIMTPEDRALIMRATPLNELAFQFMSYPFKMTEVFLRQGANFFRGIRESNPELAKVGALGLMSYTVPLVLLAGVWGFPGAELMRDALEEVIKIVWKDVENFDQDLYEYARDLPLIGSEFTADLVTRGAPHALGLFTGSTRLGLNPFQFEDLMNAGPAMALGAAGSLGTNAVNGYKFAKEGDYLNALASILPRFAGNVLRGVNVGFGEGEIRTPEGRTTINQHQIAEIDNRYGVPTWVRMAIGLPPPAIMDLRTASRYAEELRTASRPYTEWANGSIARLLAEERRALDRNDNAQADQFRAQLEELRAEIERRNERLRAEGNFAAIYRPNPRAIQDRVRDRLEGTTEAERLLQRGTPRSRENIRQMLESRGFSAD